MSQLEEILSGVSGAKVVAYSSLALDKVVLLVLFLLKRMDSGPSKTGLQAGFIFELYFWQEYSVVSFNFQAYI